MPSNLDAELKKAMDRVAQALMPLVGAFGGVPPPPEPEERTTVTIRRRKVRVSKVQTRPPP